MTESTVVFLPSAEGVEDPLTEVLRAGARHAVEAEVAALLAAYADHRTETGRRRLVRHGHGPEREILTGIGPVPVRRPKVRDRGGEGEDRIRFSSTILPRFARRTRSLDAALPTLYLLGVSSGDFGEALSELLGRGASGLSPGVIGRLKAEWQAEHERWEHRDLKDRRYVYVWADGIDLRARLEDEKQCILVLIGATPEGRKELLGFQTGFRESAQSWRELLEDLKGRGLKIHPELAIGDGALGFWKALDASFPKTRRQRCWVHKTANVLNALPKARQRNAKQDLHQILDGDRARRGGEGAGHLRRQIPGQVCEGGHLPDQGPGGSARVLRLSGGALVAHPDHEPHRERLRHGPASHRSQQGMPLPQHGAGDGLQAGDCRQQDLAPPQRLPKVAPGHPGRQIHRRHSGRRNRNPRRRLIMSSPTFDHSSPSTPRRSASLAGAPSGLSVFRLELPAGYSVSG